jgi:hypothetical protein
MTPATNPLQDGPQVSLCEQHTKQLAELCRTVDTVVDTSRSIEQALKGNNGYRGLIPSYQDHCKKDEAFHEEYYSFKRKVLTTAAFIAGTGILSGGIAGILQLMN